MAVLMNISAKLGMAGAAAIVVATVAACGSSGLPGAAAGGAPPSWAKTLGPGVTVASGNASANDGSPGGVVLGLVGAEESGDYAKACSYEEPSVQSECSSSVSQLTAAQLKSAMPVPKNIAVTYTAIDGDEALVGITGTICSPDETPSCYTNSDPAAIFDSGKSFAELWSEAVAADSNSYSLATLTKISGKWYGYSSSD
jgi:hypothetical protein